MSHLNETHTIMPLHVGKPLETTVIINNGVYPICSMKYLKNIDNEDVEILDEGKKFELKINERYKINLLYLSTLLLDCNKVGMLAEVEEIKSNKNLISECVNILINNSWYSYSVNPLKTLYILKIYLDLYPSLVKDLDLETKMNERTWIFNALKNMEKYNPEMLMGVSYESNYEKMHILFREYVEDSEITCCICLSSFPETEMVQPCDCRVHYHIECFSKLNRNCIVCKRECSRINKQMVYTTMIGSGYDNRVYFPFDDYYPVPMITSAPIRKCKGDMRYKLAIIYLQAGRLRDLFESNPGYLPDINKEIDYLTESCMPSNYMLIDNISGYAEISEVLLKYLKPLMKF